MCSAASGSSGSQWLTRAGRCVCGAMRVCVYDGHRHRRASGPLRPHLQPACPAQYRGSSSWAFLLVPTLSHEASGRLPLPLWPSPPPSRPRRVPSAHHHPQGRRPRPKTQNTQLIPADPVGPIPSYCRRDSWGSAACATRTGASGWRTATLAWQRCACQSTTSRCRYARPRTCTHGPHVLCCKATRNRGVHGPSTMHGPTRHCHYGLGRAQTAPLRERRPARPPLQTPAHRPTSSSG